MDNVPRARSCIRRLRAGELGVVDLQGEMVAGSIVGLLLLERSFGLAMGAVGVLL